VGRRKRRFRVIVEHHHTAPAAPNLVQRQFQVAAADRVWVGDMSFFSNLKNELVHHCDFVTRDQARAAIFDYIEIFYNRQRRHQTLGYVSPMQFEQMNGVS
jgi:transposase InsO family protein